MKDNITLKTIREIKIISNPIRMKILRNYYTLGKPTTVKQMAVHMGEVPANIHYHVKKLIEINVLELHHTDNVNGITAKFYIPTAKSIKIEDEDNSVDGGYINEKEIIISNIFDESKLEFLKNMRILSETEDQGTIISARIKLTEKEYHSITEYISNIVKNRIDCKNSDVEKEYLFFAGIIESEK